MLNHTVEPLQSLTLGLARAMRPGLTGHFIPHQSKAFKESLISEWWELFLIDLISELYAHLMEVEKGG